MIELNHVSKSYDQKKKAVDDVSLTIENGEIFGFLGPNGAGKTTALKMITGLLTPDQGEIQIDGLNIATHPIETKRRFSFVSDDPNIFLRLKGLEYLRFLADMYDVDYSLRVERINTLAERFDMKDALNQQIMAYSHGMRQKIVLIGALLHNPQNWILDEPMTGLDPNASFNLKRMMREHADQGKTVLFSTHVLEVAERICDRIGVISKGHLLFVGTIEELKHRYREDASLESMFISMVNETDGPRSDQEAGDM